MKDIAYVKDGNAADPQAPDEESRFLKEAARLRGGRSESRAQSGVGFADFEARKVAGTNQEVVSDCNNVR